MEVKWLHLYCGLSTLFKLILYHIVSLIATDFFKFEMMLIFHSCKLTTIGKITQKRLGINDYEVSDVMRLYCPLPVDRAAVKSHFVS